MGLLRATGRLGCRCRVIWRAEDVQKRKGYTASITGQSLLEDLAGTRSQISE